MATGPTHAMSGIVAWAGMGVLAQVEGLHLSVQEWTVGAILAAGAALLPDCDHGSATIAHTFGPLSKAFADGMHWVSHIVYRATRLRRDADKAGGHRAFTHTLVFAALAAVVTTGMAQSTNKWALPVLMVFLCGIAIRGLLHEWTPQHHALGNFVLSTTITALCWHWAYNEPRLAPLAGIAVGTGCVAHLLGDAITEEGCPILWPVPIAGKTWYPLGLPHPMRMRTGGRVELLLVLPVLTIAALWLGGTALYRLGVAPWFLKLGIVPA